MYGQEVQGNKNKLIINQTKKAQDGETILCNIDFIFGLHDSGTSILNHLSYQK